MSRLGEILNAYREANNEPRAGMARGIGISERRLRGIMTEGREPNDTEAFLIRAWLDAEKFDYIPPEDVDTSDEYVVHGEEPPQPKTPIKKKPKAEAIGIRGDARILVQMYRKANGFETDTDAATYIVKSFFMDRLKEVSDVES